MNVQNYQFVITQVLVMHTFIHIWFLCASSGVLDLDNGQSYFGQQLLLHENLLLSQLYYLFI